MPSRGEMALEAKPSRKFDAAKAVLLHFKKHVPVSDIAKIYGCDAEDVHRALAPFKELMQNPAGVQAYRENEAELLDALSMSMLSHMADPARLAKASVNNLAFGFSKVHEARRLIRGESTSNVGIRTTLVLAAHGNGALLSDSEGDSESE